MIPVVDHPILAVSGRPAFQGGAGEFVGLVQQQISVEELPMRLVCARRAYPIMGSLRYGRVFRGLAEPMLRKLDTRRLNRSLAQFAAQPNPLLIFHPQSIGLNHLLSLVGKRTFPTWIFVLDGSFFCRRSYNCLPGELGPCFRCLGNDGAAASEHGCVSPFPRGHTAREQKEFRHMAQAGHFKFMVQTQAHAVLLHEHLGMHVQVVELGLEVPGIEQVSVREDRDGFDLVYHAAPAWEKGIGCLLGLAKELPEFRFLAPFSLADLGEDRCHGGKKANWPPNVIMRPMTWANGLRTAVEKAKCVLCPSLWSAPVEGAVLKSLAHNGVVALCRERGQFGSEIPAEAIVALEPENIGRSAQVLRDLLQNEGERVRLRKRAAHYMETFRKKNAGVARRICETLLGHGIST